MAEAPLSFQDAYDKMRREEEEPLATSPGATSYIDADRLSVAAKSELTPDTASRLLSMQMETGLPTAFLERNLDDVERRVEDGNFDSDKFRKSAGVVVGCVQCVTRSVKIIIAIFTIIAGDMMGHKYSISNFEIFNICPCFNYITDSFVT